MHEQFSRRYKRGQGYLKICVRVYVYVDICVCSHIYRSVRVWVGAVPVFVCAGPSKPLLAPRFSLRIEANLDDYNKTIDIHEFYDFPGNRGSISQWDESKHTRVYFDYNTKEVLAVTYPDGEGRKSLRLFALITMLSVIKTSLLPGSIQFDY